MKIAKAQRDERRRDMLTMIAVGLSIAFGLISIEGQSFRNTKYPEWNDTVYSATSLDILLHPARWLSDLLQTDFGWAIPWGKAAGFLLIFVVYSAVTYCIYKILTKK